jgi:predicted enzyme related to lactoylglutathione lyase
MASKLTWFAINAGDVPRARRFYEQIFGWDFEPWGPPNFYLIRTGEDQREVGGLQERRELVPGTKMIGFECTVSVDSADETIRAVEANGGKVITPKFNVPGVGTIFYFQDTEGNVVGACQPEPKGDAGA